MSRGRKSKSSSNSQNWQQIFHNNVGTYLQNIIIELGKFDNSSTDTGYELFKKLKIIKESISKKEQFLSPLKLEEIPFKIPKNWYWCKLGDMFQIERGSSPRPKGDSRYFSSLKTEYNWITISDMTAFAKNEPLSDTREFLTELGTKYSRYVTPNDIIIVASGSAGRTSLLGIDGYIYDGLMAVKNISDEDLKKFLYYLFKVFESNMMGVATGATWQNINTDILKNLPIPLPPLSEQKKILAFLKDFENNTLQDGGFYFNKQVEQKVVNLHKSQLLAAENFTLISEQLTLIENLNQAILQEAVQGKLVPQDPTDEPASQLLERIKAEKGKTGKKEKPLPPIKKEEVPFEIPENWVWCRLGEICEIRGGKRVANGYKLLTTPTPHIYIRVTDMQNGTISDSDLHYIDEKMYEQIKQYTISKDDIYMTIVGATIGKCGLVPERFHNMNLTENAAKLSPTIVDKVFLFKILESSFCQNQFIDKTKQVAVQKMALNRFASSLIPLPPLSEQQRIVAEIERQLAKTKELKANIEANQQATEQLLKALLHGAFAVEEKV